MTLRYILYKNFLSNQSLEAYINGTYKIIDRFYNEDHLREHSAYFSDEKPGRNSYAFNVWSASHPGDLPAIRTELIAECSPEIANLNYQILTYLNIPDLTTRLLFNIQLYHQANSPVSKHFDGEFQAFQVNEDNSLNIIDAIRPKYVAVLTLVNHTSSGGTRLFYSDGSSEVVSAEAGDLLVFDNIECEHGADSFISDQTDGLVRMTIGWRSLDYDCMLWQNGKLAGSLSANEANRIHQEWLKTE